jgi:hypothetical protein
MKMLPSDPDIQTIVGRIRSGDLDLQPDFQRGEVWSDSKKRRLIDTILRDWHIPPIHVIERPGAQVQEVLDGQQRLVAIRDFVNGIIRVDGTIEPREEAIVAADDSTYETLPPSLRRQFDRFTIRVFRLIDFRPDEPGELFYRLNQPTSLTAAEQRNAFFGPVRTQVRRLCEQFGSGGLTQEFLGFSNSRMAYDDIVAKLLLSLERKTIRQKITAINITERYRTPKPFSNEVLKSAESALRLLGSAKLEGTAKIKFNKATLFSWLWIAARAIHEKSESCFVKMFDEYLTYFETLREKISERPGDSALLHSYPRVWLSLLDIFTDRASLRVADVSSVLLRDAILAYCFIEYIVAKMGNRAEKIENTTLGLAHRIWAPLLSRDAELTEDHLLAVIEESAWGTIP